MNLWDLIADILGALGSLLWLVWDKLLSYAERYLRISAAFYRLLVASFTELASFRMILRDMVKQVYFTAVRGVHILIIAALFLGLHIILYSIEHLTNMPYEEFVGWLLVTIVVREIGPILAGFFVLIHSGGAITVEIGTMSVTHEIEALQVMGIDPYRYLGVPRFWGVTISVVLLYIVIAHAAVLGGYKFSQIYSDISLENFRYYFINMLQVADLTVGFIKSVLFGLVISTVSIYAGFEANGDMGEVAKKTAQGALWSLVLCGAINIIITTAYYLSPHHNPLLPLSSLSAILSGHLC